MILAAHQLPDLAACFGRKAFEVDSVVVNPSAEKDARLQITWQRVFSLMLTQSLLD
jgi:hypothetical protein